MKLESPLLLSALATLLLSTAAQATQADQVHASGGWLRLMPANLPAGGYLVLSNPGDTAVSLVAVDSPRYGMTMLHQSQSHGGMTHMQKLAHLVVPAHGEVRLAPGGYHLMFSQPKGSIHPGDVVPVQLHFSDHSELSVLLAAKPANADN